LIAIGPITRGLVLVVWTERDEDILRIISARWAHASTVAGAMGISVHTLRNWEQGRRCPEGPAIALLRIAARHPRIIRENVEAAA
jgi:putative transcriptional regulator